MEGTGSGQSGEGAAGKQETDNFKIRSAHCNVIKINSIKIKDLYIHPFVCERTAAIRFFINNFAGLSSVKKNNILYIFEIYFI